LPSISHHGITLCYQTDGDPGGTPLLLIMGLGMQLTSWPESLIAPLVQQGYYLIRFDNRDAGLSSKLDHHGKPNIAMALIKNLLRIRLKAPYLLRDMAGDALAVLDALNVEQAHVVGVSMGGMIAQILAADHPQRVKSLTSIMSTSGRRGLPGPTRRVRNMLLQRPRDAQQVIDHFIRTFQTIGSPGYPTPEPLMRSRVQANLNRASSPNGTLRQMLAIGASGNRVRELRAITRPTLVIHGAHDPLVPLACGEDTARHVSGAVLRVIDGMGHDLPDALMPVIASMIDAHCKGRDIAHAAQLLASGAEPNSTQNTTQNTLQNTAHSGVQSAGPA
jgi:proline iminopeptidase